MIKLLFQLPVLLLFTTVVFADGFEQESEQTSEEVSQKQDKSSENFKKTKRFLPGEEVVSPQGKKTKVWSTKGPVPVSRAPEPFEDKADSVIKDSHIVIDAEEVRRRQKREREGDSFRVED